MARMHERNPDRVDRSTSHPTNTTARTINVLLGAWTFISAFVWLHSSSQFWNAIVVGAGVAIVAMVAVRASALRFVNAALGAWLFFSVWAIPTLASATSWNNWIVGAMIFLVSLFGAYRPRRREHRDARRPLTV